MKEVPFYIIESDETSTFADRCIKSLKESNLSDTFISQVLGQLIQLALNLSQALGRIRKSEHTEKLLGGDKKRDKYYIGFRDYAVAISNNPDEAQAAAAKKLVVILENAGTSLYRLNYTKESAQLNALFVELEKTEAKQAITTIGADTLYQAMKEAQTAFETIYQQKVVKNNETEIPLVLETTKTIKFYLGSLFSYIEANTILNPAVYKPVSDKLDTIITDVTTVARARQTRKEKEKAEAAETGSTAGLAAN